MLESSTRHERGLCLLKVRIQSAVNDLNKHLSFRYFRSIGLLWKEHGNKCTFHVSYSVLYVGLDFIFRYKLVDDKICVLKMEI